MPSYLSVLKLQNCSSQCSSCEFLRKIEEKLFWVIKAINEASATNFIINLSHILYVTSDAKALCSILYSSGNIQIKGCWGLVTTLPAPPSLPPPPFSFSLSWQKSQHPEGYSGSVKSLINY